MKTVKELVKAPEPVRVMGYTFQLRAIRNRHGGFNVVIEMPGKKQRIRGGANGDQTVGELITRFNEVNAGYKPTIELIEKA